jgi:cobalt-zinc-cadmium efflux system membrane fusion protein
MSTPKYIHYLISLSLLVALSCSKKGEETVAEEHHDEEETVVELTEAQLKTADVVLGPIENKQISGTIRVNGKLDVPPQQLISISAPLGGFLKSTSLLEGSRVKKGQLIATIENLDFIQIQQDYIEAKSQFDLAKADYDRQQELAKDNVNSQKTLQQAQSTFKTWQAKSIALEEKLRVLNIKAADVESGSIKSTINLYSPIDGYVTEVSVNIGKFANPTDVLFEIVDTEHLHAELIVFEKDVPKLKIGQKVRFMLANETMDRMATIYLIGRQIGENRTVQIHCHIDKEDKELLPGMYLSALVETGGAMVPALPNEALIDYQGKKYVFMLMEENHEEADHKEGEKEAAEDHHDEGTHFELVEVQVGHSELGYTEILSSDSLNNAQIVVKGGYALLSKMKNSEEEGGHAH